MRISVRESRDLQAVIASLAGLDKAIRTAIRAHTRNIGLPEWISELRQQGQTRVDHRVLVDTATLRVSDQNITLMSASKGRKLSGGLDPKKDAPAVEFGGHREKVTTVTSRRGKSFKRHTARQLEDRTSKGRVVYPAAARMIPRIASLWVQTVVRTVHEVLENR